MTQSDRRQFLLRELLKEQPEYAGIQIPKDIEKQKALLRSLMNVRPPRPVSQKFLAIQDAYLQEELQLREITDGNMLPSIPLNPHIALWQGDITALKADAIVNAANSTLLGCFRPLHSALTTVFIPKAAFSYGSSATPLRNGKAAANQLERLKSHLRSTFQALIFCIR